MFLGGFENHTRIKAHTVQCRLQSHLAHMQVGDAVREAAGIQKVPTFQVWLQGKNLAESYLAGTDLNEAMVQVTDMLNRHLEGVADSAFR